MGGDGKKKNGDRCDQTIIILTFNIDQRCLRQLHNGLPDLKPSSCCIGSNAELVILKYPYSKCARVAIPATFSTRHKINYCTCKHQLLIAVSTKKPLRYDG